MTQDLASIDIEAVQRAVSALQDAGISPLAITDIDRQTDDGKVRFTLTVEANTREADLTDFTD